MGLSTTFNTIYAFWRYARKQDAKFVDLGENLKFFNFSATDNIIKEEKFYDRNSKKFEYSTGLFVASMVK